MSVEQVVFAVAGAVCIVGVVIAVTHRDPRAASGALVLTLLSLAALSAGVGAPAVAAAAVVVALVAAVPIVMRLTPSASDPHAEGGPVVAGAALLLGAAILAILVVAITFGELPVNVSVRSSDGDDLAALRDLLAGRASVVVGGSVVLLTAAAWAMWAARRDRRRDP
jgi:NADH:ubiquinone oxidoreductase subunit 6 (subunit J)